jgi:L-ribulose-5-phosphate 4-epimerase
MPGYPTLKELKEAAFEANREIPRHHLAIYTWGNVSAFDESRGVFAIKPSGVPYEALTLESMVIVDLDGAVVEGAFKPSSDMETHRVLYMSFPGIGGITHTHAVFSTAWAQARRSVPVLGTTHADYSAGEIPCTPLMDEAAVKKHYERETGSLIVDTFAKRGLSHRDVPMVLVAGHGPFTWGKNAAESVYHAVTLEEICKMAYYTVTLNPVAEPLPAHITGKHWERKHGDTAYYGQR